MVGGFRFFFRLCKFLSFRFFVYKYVNRIRSHPPTNKINARIQFSSARVLGLLKEADISLWNELSRPLASTWNTYFPPGSVE